MVNNVHFRAHFLRPFFLLLFFLCAWQFAAAQKIARQYTASLQANGTLYFIEPRLTFKSSQEPAELAYDLTYLDSKDSVTLNFTYISPMLKNIDSLRLTAGSLSLSSPSKKIFIEDDKNDWKHRYSSRFLYADLARLMQQQETLALVLEDNNTSTVLTAAARKWKKQAAVLGKIFHLIEANQ